MVDIEVGEWYRRGAYRFVKPLEINGDKVSAYTITYFRDLQQVSRGMSSWDLDFLQEYFTPTNEDTILMLLETDNLDNL